MGAARIGILGASGYMGGEALRVVLEHPELELAWATSRSGGAIEDWHPDLVGSGVELTPPEHAEPCDGVLIASLPTGEAILAAARYLDAGSRVVDLGAAFRLRDRAVWERVYGQSHPHWELAREAIYGVSELHGPDIAQARLVANPGCFSSAAILGLAPLVREGWVDTQTLVVDGLSGTAGMGAELTRVAHHAEIGNNLVPYAATGHRHTYEMEQELGQLARRDGGEVRVHFTPVYVPITRGILALCHGFARRSVSRAEVLELVRDFYADAPFVDVWDRPSRPDDGWPYRAYPWVSAVCGTNRCLLGVDVDEERGRIVVMSVLDSIGKGGARVGIENLNLMLGLPRTSGLARRALHP